MFSRTKLSDPVDRTIIAVCPAKNAEVQALASETPDGVTFSRLTSISSNVRAPSVLGAL
jgi:hypothetical protein